MRNLFVKTALVLCTTIIFLPATVFATEPQNTEITSAEEGFTDSDPSVSYENDNSLTLDEEEDDKKTGRYIRRERYAGACERSFYVGEDVTQEEIKGEYKHGILKLFVPKKEAKPVSNDPKYITIE